MNLLFTFEWQYILDIAVIVFLLAGGIVGAKKGFIKTFFGFVSTLVALVLAFILADDLLKIVCEHYDITGFFSDKIETSLLKIKTFQMDISAAGIEESLKGVSLPSFVIDSIIEQVGVDTTLPAGTTLASQVAPVFGKYVSLGLSGLAIFIVSKLILFIICKILTAITKAWSLLSAINGILGFVLGVVKMAITVCIIMSILSLIPVEGITEIFEKTYLLKYVFNNNPITIILGKFI